MVYAVMCIDKAFMRFKMELFDLLSLLTDGNRGWQAWKESSEGLDFQVKLNINDCFLGNCSCWAVNNVAETYISSKIAARHGNVYLCKIVERATRNIWTYVTIRDTDTFIVGTVHSLWERVNAFI